MTRRTATTSGMVTIPADEYRALVRDRAELARVKTGALEGVISYSSRASFRHDVEVVAFVNRHATTQSLGWLTTECGKRFGNDRAPSRSALARYVGHLRRHFGLR